MGSSPSTVLTLGYGGGSTQYNTLLLGFGTSTTASMNSGGVVGSGIGFRLRRRKPTRP